MRPSEDLRSLGSLFYEPVWLFYREDSARRLLKQPTLTSLSQLPGRRINGDTEAAACARWSTNCSRPMQSTRAA